MFDHTWRMAAAATVACAALAVPATASANETPLTSRVLTVKQFPGWQVAQKPTVTPPDTKSDKCTTADPAGSTTVATALTTSRKLSATRVLTTSVSENVIETRTAAQAKALFIKARALAVTCGLGASPSGSRLRFTLLRGTVVPGATQAFVLAVSAPRSTRTVQGKTVTTTIAGRVSVYLSGRRVVAITPSRVTTTVSGSHISATAVDDSYTRALTTKAATAAIKLLG